MLASSLGERMRGEEGRGKEKERKKGGGQEREENTD